MLQAKFHPQGLQFEIEVTEQVLDKNGNPSQIVQRGTFVLPSNLLHWIKPLASVPAEEQKQEKKSE